MKKKSLMWKDEPLLERLQRCRIMLSIHGVLGAQESYRCAERIERRWLKEQERKKLEKRNG